MLGLGIGQLGFTRRRGERQNLLASQDVSGAGWAAAGSPTITGGVLAPDGSLTAQRVARITTDATFVFAEISKATLPITYTYSHYFRQASARYVALRLQGLYPGRVDATFDFEGAAFSTAPVVSGTFSSASASITSLADGWFRVTLTATSDAHTSILVAFSPLAIDAAIDVADSSATSSVDVWHARLVGP